MYSFKYNFKIQSQEITSGTEYIIISFKIALLNLRSVNSSLLNGTKSLKKFNK